MTTLNADATRKILTYAECDGIDAWRATNKFARETASDDLVWRAAATRDFYGGAGAGRDYHGQPVDFSPAPATPEAPASRSNGAPCERVNHPETWREAYVCWRRLALRVDGPRDNYPRYANAPRTVWQESVHERPRGERRERRCGDPFHAPTWLGVCAAWRAIKAALAGTPAVASLRPPASQKDLAYVGARSLRYCYAVHDGQALAFDEAIRSQNRRQMKAAQATIFHGIFGGFSAYDYVVCTRFRPIAAVVAEIAATDEEEAGSGDELANKQGNWTCHHMFSFGANYRGDRRFQVCSADRVMFVEGNARAAPDGPDAFLRWFAEYARRVAARAYRVAPIMPDAPDVSAGVVLFPDADAGDDCRVVEAVTNGVRVRASSVYLPNHPSGFAYFRRADIPRTGRNDATTATRIFRGDESPRRRGRDVEIRSGPAPASGTPYDSRARKASRASSCRATGRSSTAAGRTTWWGTASAGRADVDRKLARSCAAAAARRRDAPPRGRGPVRARSGPRAPHAARTSGRRHVSRRSLASSPCYERAAGATTTRSPTWATASRRRSTRARIGRASSCTSP